MLFFLSERNKMTKEINLAVPLNAFGRLATAAALDGMDITRWVKRKIQRAAADGTLARFAAARKAEKMEAAATSAGAPLTPEKQ